MPGVDIFLASVSGKLLIHLFVHGGLDYDCGSCHHIFGRRPAAEPNRLNVQRSTSDIELMRG